MLPRTAEQVALGIESYRVAADGREQVLGCGALHEYSPSAAEVAAIGVSSAAQGHGIGGRLVRAVEDLARARGHDEVFLVTVRPDVFQRLGYRIVPATRFPEKHCPHARPLATCTRCEKYCLWRRLRSAVHVVARWRDLRCASSTPRQIGSTP